MGSPRLECQLHSTLRFVQTGAVIGFALGQVLGLYRGYRCKSPLLTTSALLSAQKASNWMFGMGTLSVPATFAYFKIKNYESVDFYDRAYRLRCSAYQLRIDRACLLGAVCGG